MVPVSVVSATSPLHLGTSWMLVPLHLRMGCVEHAVHMARVLVSPPSVNELAPHVVQAAAPVELYLLSAPHGTFVPLPSQA
jgi:hypothetical protein